MLGAEEELNGEKKCYHLPIHLGVSSISVSITGKCRQLGVSDVPATVLVTGDSAVSDM